MSLVMRPVRVTRLERSGPQAWTLFWSRDFDFRPGQMVALSLEPNQTPRYYSLATGYHETEAGILFNLVPEGQLTPPLSRIRPGDNVWISDPLGTFLHQPGPSIWIANGTGVAPFLSMARSGLASGHQLIHGARYRADFYSQDELVRLLGDAYHRCASADSGEGLFAGRLTTYLSQAPFPQTARYDLCGSTAMVIQVRDLLLEQGVAFQNIHSEVYF